ncbi:MAG: response regulator transcription factor [Clostridia bacterium]|nr:response regulator transcription factor [Clostridia bacterium]
MNNNRYKILLVEDEVNIRNMISALLDANGYQVIPAGSFYEAKTMYFSYIPDLVILDLGLPDKDGSSLVEVIREKDLTPIIVLSARGDESEKVRLLDLGANDFITKPFGSAELLARVRTSLRNYRHSADEGRLPGGRFTLLDLVIDYDARRVFLKDEEIRLTQTEYNIMALLSEHCGKMMTYSSIIKAVWREYPDEGNIKRLQVNMANIRKKLGLRPGDNKYIVNELGVGYRLQDES